ncbi:armadillo-type protein [Nemania sp. FL0916]|nr:armadillo-type protein [Nemania sp. FL0916]
MVGLLHFAIASLQLCVSCIRIDTALYITVVGRAMIGWLGWVTTCVAVFGSLLFLYPLASRIRRRDLEPRPDGIQIISDPVNAKFEIVAVHGLGAHPEWTWTCNAHTVREGPRRRTHLLRDLLTESFPKARILSFAHNSDWLINAPVKTAQQIGERLLDQLIEDRERRRQRLPIVFIGHSFGGIIIKEALCRSGDAAEIVHDTCGILFLGTPHQGSPLSVFRFIIAWATTLLGSSIGFLFALRRHSDQLSDLDSRFDNVRKNLKDAEICSLHETIPFYVLGFLSIGLIVDRDSAKGPADKSIGINTNHSGLNKCSESSGELYEAILGAIVKFRQRASLLERGDKQIRDSYTKEKLDIVRLSGSILPMSQCYINLAIIRKNLPNDRSADEFGRPGFRPSLLQRLNVEEPNKELHVNLPNLFDPCTIRDDEKNRQPRRILIRGRPGVGKTTLCKKIVHDFIYDRLWNDYFTRLLWVPLRRLQGRQGRYKLTDLFHDEYFPLYENPELILNELYQGCRKPDAGGSLFLLDGLDEIRPHLSRDSHFYEFVQELLNQPNVLVTSRPSVQLQGDFRPFDLELETIGFYSDQVKQYVKYVTTVDASTNNIEEPEKSQKILSSLEEHTLIGDLVCIPILLDAFCFAWDDVSGTEPQTMTDLYQAIETGLWRKDLGRLVPAASKEYVLSVELEGRVHDEIVLLEKLAFAGLYHDLTVFDAKVLNMLSRYLAMPNGKTIDQTLRDISFIRSSNVSPNDKNRNYYFLHLTLQEYFAARHFRRSWAEGKDLELAGTKVKKLHPVAFLQRYKYLEKFDIVWRFAAGLLGSDAEHQTQFFEAIETEPLDLLGPAHHRLLMRCLFEVHTSNKFMRKRFEIRLSSWSIFEYNYKGGITLPADRDAFIMREMEFPTGALSKLSEEDNDHFRIHILKSLNPRRIASTEILQVVVLWLRQSLNQELVLAVLDCLKEFFQNLSDEHFQITRQPLISQDSNHKGTVIGKFEYRSDLAATLQAVMENLENDSSRIRVTALLVLRGLSNLSKEILHLVIKKLGNSNSDVQDAAVRALETQSNMPALIQTVAAKLEDTNLDVQRVAMRVLSNYLDLPEIHQAIVSKLEDIDFEVQCAAIQALETRLDVPVILQALLAKFKDDNPEVQCTAIRALEKRLDVPVILQAVLAKFKDDDPKVQCAAIDVFQEHHNPTIILKAMVEKLESNSYDVLWMAGSFLRRQSNLPEDVLQAIVAKFDNKSADVRLAALEILEEQSGLPKAILDAVIAMLHDDNSSVKCGTIRVLKNHLSISTVFQEIAARFEDDDPDVRCAAIEGLQNYPSLPKATLQAVVANLESRDLGVQWAAADVLSKQSSLPEEIRRAVIAKLEDSDPNVLLAVLKALQWQSHGQEAVLRKIVPSLENDSKKIRHAAATAIQEQPNLSGEILQAVAHIINKKDQRDQKVALSVLHGQSYLPEAILETIAGELGSSSSHVRRAAMKVLQEQSRLPDSVLSSISRTLVCAGPWDLARIADVLLRMFKKFPKLLTISLGDPDSLKGLYTFLLQESLDQHIAWYHDGGKLYLVIDGDVIEYESRDPRSMIDGILPPDVPAPDYPPLQPQSFSK